jgi:hypothetical protein
MFTFLAWAATNAAYAHFFFFLLEADSKLVCKDPNVLLEDV